MKSSTTEDERDALLQITTKYKIGATLLPIKSVGVQVMRSTLNQRCSFLFRATGHASLAPNLTTACLLTLCVYDKDHTSALRLKNKSESDPRSYEVT